MSLLDDFICKLTKKCVDDKTAQLNAQVTISEQQIAQQQAEAELKSQVALERTKTIGKVVIVIVIVVAVFIIIKKVYK